MRKLRLKEFLWKALCRYDIPFTAPSLWLKSSSKCLKSKLKIGTGAVVLAFFAPVANCPIIICPHNHLPPQKA